MAAGSPQDVLGQVPLPAASMGSGEALAGLLSDQRQAAREANFDVLLPLSWTLLGAGRGHASAIRAVRSSQSAQARAASDFAGELLQGLTELAGRSDHVEQAQGIRERLQSIDPDLAARADPLLDQVGAGQLNPGVFDEARATAAALGRAPGTEFEADLCVAATVRGLLGVLQTVVNLSEPPTPDLGLFEVALAEQQQAGTAVTDLLRAGEMGLHAACATGQKPAIEQAAEELGETVRQLLVPAAALQARGRTWSATLRQAGRNGDAERLGRVLARGGLLLRQAIADAAVGQLVLLDLALPTPTRAVQGLLESAVSGAFETTVPDGRDTEVAHLGPEHEGVFVQVEGFVVEATAGREADGKLVGRLLLEDPSSLATVELSTVFVHPAHVGITTGSFVVAHGIYRVSSARLGGRPGLEVDALAPSAMSQQSWQARLWFSAARWVDVWRGDLNLAWSLGTHTAGPDDSQEATRGAAELIYVPFARTST